MTDATVYVVEDDEAVRDSLEMLLKAEKLPVTTYPEASSFLDAWNPRLTGCIVLDIRMPGMDGMELQKKLLEKGCELPIIFVTGHGDVPLAVEAMQHGAVDFVQKPYRDQELLEKIRKALAKDAASQDLRLEKQEIQKRMESLTPREKEIMDMMIDGNANKVIAIDLNISQRTVEIHRSRVMQKMGTHSLAQLVRMVMTARDEV